MPEALRAQQVGGRALRLPVAHTIDRPVELQRRGVTQQARHRQVHDSAAAAPGAFACIAHVDQRETLLERGTHRREFHSRFSVVRVGCWLLRTPMGDAVGGAARTQPLRAERDQVEDQHFIRCQPGKAQQQLERLECLQTAEHARNRPQHARLGAIAYQAITRGLGPYTSQTRRAVVATYQLQLAFVLIDAREQHRLAQAQRNIVQQELGGEVVAAVEDEIGTFGQCCGVAGIEPHGVRGHLNFGIERAHSLRRELGLGLAAVGQRVPGLAMQVGGLQMVRIHDGEPADTRARQVLQHRHAQPARTHHQHRRATQALLSRRTHLTQRHLPRVVRSGAG